ncbi:hypothetical protein HYS48_04405 [Candidatus Woesearchaeota archaeon]|nr:hypothetical protein [Candidatus Woesearchaeota archaeon]
MEEEKEALDQCKDELKRVDHLIYVSLKYTRTCDVFKNIITRLIDAIDFALDALLRKIQEQGKIMEIPQAAKTKGELVLQHIQEEWVKEMVSLYLQFRQIDKAPFTREREYRRHVTMTCKVEGTEIKVTIDNITEYYKRTKMFVEQIEKMVREGNA